MYFHISIIDEIVGHMDYLTIACFAATCREYGHYGKISHQQMAKCELIRCADIYNCIEYAPLCVMEELDGVGNSPSPTFEKWEHTWGITTANAIQSTLLDQYYLRAPPTQFRHFDPELFDLLRDDARMLAPQDTCLTYNFYKSVFSIR